MASIHTKAPEGRARNWRDESAMLSRPIGLLAGVLAAAVLLIGTASWFGQGQRDALVAAQQVRNAAAARFHNVETEKQDIATFQPHFLELQTSSGLLGDENRLGWIEAVRQIQTQRRLVSASYAIEPQQNVALHQPMALGDYQLRASRMRVQLGLVHELDLFHFIDDLRSAGRFAVQDCQIKRSDAPPEAVGVAGLLADCTLVWVTLASPAKETP